MTERYSIGKRLLSMLICLCMVAAWLPNMGIRAEAATPDYTTVDPHTLDQWQQYFGVQTNHPNQVSLSTEFAGGIWTDKSVFDPDNIPAQLTDAKYNGNSFPITDKGDNFLVSLSAIASNKQIKGYSTIPTDTVLVLDLSSSMRYTDDDGNSAVDELIEATNKAIDDLLELNKNNRVAVVVYAGNVNKSFSSGQGITQIVMPLDSYTTDQSGVYLQADPLTVRQGNRNVPNTNPYGLAVYDGVSSATGKTNAFRSNSFEVSTGTFMQDGIYEAMKLLNAAETKVTEGVQTGTNRLPIVVLMTDGESTMANPDYNGNDNNTDLGNSTMYDYEGNTGTNGYGHRDTMAFVTSLTAAYAKKQIKAHYGEEPLLYTLPYGTSVMNRGEALSVLNPAQASTTQNNLWNRFLNDEDVTVYRYRNNYSGPYQYYTVRNSAVPAERLTAEDRLYVDKYFPANNDEQMLQAFEAIVEEIIVQSKYYPTYVEKDHDHDGYLTFVDKIGEYMEVSDIKGIVVGDRLFSGAALASKFNAGDLGTIERPESLGDNLVWSVKERLGITDTQVAQALLNNAYEHGQLSYTSDTQFSHYIGWYSDADGNYVDFWHEDMTGTAPTGATHIIKSYGFMGDTTVVPGVSNTDMMYMTVRVATQIATGESILTWQIPASLVPTLTYEVEVTLDGEGNITELNGLEIGQGTADSPIRLLYEVELRHDIYDWNLTEKVNPNYTTHKDAGYVFYSNKWNDDFGDTTRNTYSHFEPSVKNERYYYTQDTVVLEKTGTDTYAPYTGAQPSGDGYHRSFQVFEKRNNGDLVIHTHYEPITAEALAQAGAVEALGSTGRWVVKKDTVHRYYDFETTQKVTGNDLENTGTMDYSDHPFVVKQNDAYYTYSTQGNNGRLEMTPATGIKLTKTLAEGFTTNAQSFTFKIASAVSLDGAMVVRLDADGLEASRTALPASGEVSVAAGETVYIVGLQDATYTVSEKITQGADYKVSAVKVDDRLISEKQASITLTDRDITGVEFINGAMSYGDLIVSKDVTHPFDTVPDALTQKQFTIQVTLSGADVAGKTFQATGAGVASVTTNENGVFEVQLRDGESVTVKGLPEGTAYTVTEILTSADAGYSMDDANSILSGTIDAAAPALGHVVNLYDPAQADETLVFTGTKTLTNEQNFSYDWTGKSFTFKLESYDPATGVYTQIGQSVDVTTNGGTYTFPALTFDTLGTYYYKVSEVIPANDAREEGMSYDATTGRVVVHVTDRDVDGKLEVDVRDYTTGQSLTPSNGVYTFTKDFENIFVAGATYVEFEVSKKIEDEHNTGVGKAGFLFGLYKVEGGVTVAQPSYTMRTVGNDGKAVFHIPLRESGTTTYILKEIPPAVEDRTPGMEYDTTEYTVVVVANAVNNQLVPSVSFSKDGSPVVEADLVFTNKINLRPASVQWTVNKVVDGVNPVTAEEFTFTLTETDGSFVTPKNGGVSQSVNITGAGANSFNAISYTKVGTHYYVIKETAGDRGGMHYDGAEYHITVNVTVNGNALEAATTVHKLGVGTVEATQINFINTYSISGQTAVTISGTKTLTGRPMLNGEFRFRLTEVADAAGTAVTNPFTLTAENGPADGDNEAPVQFAPITYTQVGTHYYQITEIPGNDGLGITYDTNTAYIVRVTVSDNGVGGLTSAWTVVNANNAAVDQDIEFANTYTPKSTSAQFSAGKELTGRVLKDGEFAFELYTTGSNFDITGLQPTQVVNNDIHGVIRFAAIGYNAEGTHHYVVREKAGSLGGVTYDDTLYYVTVRVVDNHAGQLETFTSIEMVDVVEEDGAQQMVRIPASSIVFYNEYSAEDGVLGLTVQKTVSGGWQDLSGFRFGLYEDLNGAPIQTVTTDADGIVSFQELVFTHQQVQTGTFTYYIKEINDGQKGFAYDPKVYTVVVQLTDNADGTLLVTYTVDGEEVDESAYRFAFHNVYTPEDITVALDITKTVKVNSGEGVSPAGFKFQLADKNGVLGTVESDSNGKAQFQVIFQAEDVGKTFDFAITELDTKVTGVTYSKVKHEVQITITQNAAGELVPQLKLGGEAVDAVAVSFVNTFDAAETPETGDSFNGGMLIMLMAASAFGLVTLLLGKKKKFEC